VPPRAASIWELTEVSRRKSLDTLQGHERAVMAGLDGHLHRMVAEWVCIVRKLVRVADGRVKPGHDGGRESVFWAFGIFAI
jgi:hypothetical protein